MFQYAFGYALSQEKKDDYCFDLGFYENQPKHVSKRNECLRLFFPGIPFKEEKRPKKIRFYQNRIINHVLYRHFKRYRKLSNNLFYFKEKRYQFYDLVPHQNGALNYYDGYWQSEDYFKLYSDSIKRFFTPSNEILLEVNKWMRIANEDLRVALHVRRGDLFGNSDKAENQAMLNYYRKSMHYLRKTVGKFVLFVLSDDLEWCRLHLDSLNERIVFVKNEGPFSALIDLFVIANCNHGIMSRSTFSWWGNWLGMNDNRIVVAPSGVYFNERFIPKKWVVI